MIETGRPKEAITILKKATEINTKFAMSFANLGIAYRYDSQYDHAEASYQRQFNLIQISTMHILI